MASKHLVIETHEPGVRVIKISRPEALNALNTQVLRELGDQLRADEKDAAVRVIVLTGDGEKSFVAGADIAEMKDKSPGEGVDFAQLGHEVMRMLDQMAKPTIAAVNGFALGGGTELAISCDFIVASEKAVFGQPEVALGIIPGFGATFRLARFVGAPRAKELIFSGRRIKADEALRIGLANAVLPAEGFLEKVVELAQTISRNSFSAVARAKILINEFQDHGGISQKIDAEAHAFGRLFGTPDQREGMGAFVAKRKPSFQGL
jgi:enoyl-CoA hydratase